MLHSVATDAVASKRAALLWGLAELPAEWRPLLEAALEGRALGWDPDVVPAAAEIEATQRFAAYAARVAADRWTSA